MRVLFFLFLCSLVHFAIVFFLEFLLFQSLICLILRLFFIFIFHFFRQFLALLSFYFMSLKLLFHFFMYFFSLFDYNFFLCSIKFSFKILTFVSSSNFSDILSLIEESFNLLWKFCIFYFWNLYNLLLIYQ